MIGNLSAVQGGFGFVELVLVPKLHELLRDVPCGHEVRWQHVPKRDDHLRLRPPLADYAAKQNPAYGGVEQKDCP